MHAQVRVGAANRAGAMSLVPMMALQSHGSPLHFRQVSEYDQRMEHFSEAEQQLRLELQTEQDRVEELQGMITRLEYELAKSRDRAQSAMDEMEINHTRDRESIQYLEVRHHQERNRTYAATSPCPAVLYIIPCVAFFSWAALVGQHLHRVLTVAAETLSAATETVMWFCHVQHQLVLAQERSKDMVDENNMLRFREEVEVRMRTHFADIEHAKGETDGR